VLRSRCALLVDHCSPHVRDEDLNMSLRALVAPTNCPLPKLTSATCTPPPTKNQVLKMEGEELSKHGPSKLPEKQGLDEYSEAPVEKGPFYAADPTGRRTGNGT
jgi:hypothetical protein